MCTGVGKSCLLLQFTDKRFQPVHDLTIGNPASPIAPAREMIVLSCASSFAGSHVQSISIKLLALLALV
jgi:hypothetical protein